MIRHEMTSSAFDVPGFAATHSFGIVRGIVVRSRSVFGTIGAGLQTMIGGDITIFTELCEKTREDAFNRMLEHAAQLGADGVIGVRYDATEIMQGVTEGALLWHRRATQANRPLRPLIRQLYNKKGSSNFPCCRSSSRSITKSIPFCRCMTG